MHKLRSDILGSENLIREINFNYILFYGMKKKVYRYLLKKQNS